MKAPPSISQFLLLSESRAYIKSLVLFARGTAAINGVPPCRFPPNRAWCNAASSRVLLLHEEDTGGPCRSENLGLPHGGCSWSTALFLWVPLAQRCGCLFGSDSCMWDGRPTVCVTAMDPIGMPGCSEPGLNHCYPVEGGACVDSEWR